MASSDTLVFQQATAILPDRLLPDCQIICRNGRIVHVGKPKATLPANAQIVSARGKYVAPGFVDIHVHGGAGADFMDGTVEAIRTGVMAHTRHGTTTIFPTTTTGSVAQIEAMLQSVRQAQTEHQPEHGARIAGVHLYGPYFAKGKTGCHSEAGCREPTATENARYFKTGLIRIATCAAELPGAEEFYRQAKRHRCLITCGHSNSSWTEMARAYKAGMRHVDHFWCAMSSVASVRGRLGTPMQGSMLEFVLGHPEMSTEVIADGQHLAPELIQFAWQMKTSRRLCIVTDCNRALDLPPGKYLFGPESEGTEFIHDGKVGRTIEGNLASSVMGMDHMIQTVHRSTKIPLPEIIRMASLTPAELTGIDAEVGSVSKGKHADLLLLNRKLEIQRVYVAGTRVV